MTKKLVIGRLGDAFGIHGWLHLFSFAEEPADLFRYKAFSTAAGQSITFTSHKPHGNHFVVKIKEANDRDQALLFKNQDLYISREELPKLPENQFYWDDLVGLSVITEDQTCLGTVDHLFSTGANDVIAIKGKTLLYIPYLPDVILSVDLEKKVIVVAWEP